MANYGKGSLEDSSRLALVYLCPRVNIRGSSAFDLGDVLKIERIAPLACFHGTSHSLGFTTTETTVDLNVDTGTIS
jgi:hypothetical protein